MSAIAFLTILDSSGNDALIGSPLPSSNNRGPVLRFRNTCKLLSPALPASRVSRSRVQRFRPTVASPIQSRQMLPFASSGSKVTPRHHVSGYSNGYPRGNTFELSPHRCAFPSPHPSRSSDFVWSDFDRDVFHSIDSSREIQRHLSGDEGDSSCDLDSWQQPVFYSGC
jgi:hypothetical protein